MKAIKLSLTAGLALVGCQPPSRTSDGGAAGEQPATRQVPVVTSLRAIEGSWAIARFGTFEPGWRTNVGWRGAYVHVSGDGLGYSIGCNHSGNRASIDENGVLHHQGGGASTLMGCPDGEVRDQDFYAFFATNPVVSRLGDDRIQLANERTKLVLERPELRRRSDPPQPEEVQGRWVPQFVDIFKGSGMSGFTMEEPRGVVTISDRAISWTGCPEATVQVTYTSNLRLERRSEPRGNCKLGEGPGQDGAARLMRLMRSNPSVERTGHHRMVLFSPDEALHLERE